MSNNSKTRPANESATILLREVSTAPTNGQLREATCDETGALILSGGGGGGGGSSDLIASKAVPSLGLVNEKVLETGAGRLLSVEIELEPTYTDDTGGALIYLDILDTATIPTDGDVSSHPLLASLRIDHVYGTADTPSAAWVRGVAFVNGCVAYLTLARYPTKALVSGGPWAQFNAEVM